MMSRFIPLTLILPLLLAGCTRVVPVQQYPSESARIAELEKRVAALEAKQGRESHARP